MLTNALNTVGQYGMAGLGALGNVVDLPGSAARDLLAGKGLAGSFDQFATPFSDGNRTSGRELLRHYGMAGDDDNWGNFAGGMAVEAATDPLNLIGGGWLKQAAKARATSMAANRGIDAANAVSRSHPAMVSPLVAGRSLVDDIPNAAHGGVAGYLPDHSQDLIPGTRRMERTADEYLASHPMHSKDYRAPGESSYGKYDYHNDARPAFQVQYTTPPSQGVADFAHELNLKHAAETGEYAMPRSNEYTKSGSIFSGPSRVPTSEYYMDAIRGLNAGHALQQAVIQVPAGGSARLIREMPDMRSLSSMDEMLQGMPLDDVMKEMNTRHLMQEVRPAPFSVPVQSKLPEISDRLIRQNPEQARHAIASLINPSSTLAGHNLLKSLRKREH